MLYTQITLTEESNFAFIIMGAGYKLLLKVGKPWITIRQATWRAECMDKVKFAQD